MNLAFRGPFARWPRASDAVLAVVLFASVALLRDGPDDQLVYRPITDVPLAVLAVQVGAAVALYRRRRAPLPVLGVVLVCWALLVATDNSLAEEYDVGFLMVAALYSVGRYEANSRRALAGLGATYAVLVLDILVLGLPWGETAFGFVFLFVVWYIGRRLRLRADNAERQRRQRADELRRIVAEERTHIARELHDVVAHQVSMMTVQAGAAQAVADTDPVGARQAMAAVEQAGRQTLDELRHLLGVLRPESMRNGVGPQPGLADVPRLIDQVSAAGLDVRITDELATPLPTRVQLSAYRIVQEALTNVVKHAGPGTRADVHLREEGTDVVIEVTDDAAPGVTRPQAAGHGIVGMRERATLLGGSLVAAPRPDGGFRVLARFPRDGASA
ncbi:sensor histidine kinase [Cryptosporangium aurantiacum]|uniref:histidine kinase n=1 Tax=Cryptosporangium aurantiacum TaxID=134849 RepID=A0A1M7RJM8_9ACTN|nr:histidine kinase [Cryptosporangium aurantiacum]SHN46507.1 Signal transduction histidine kinase [Cryptosporangium aurantiacum]